MSALDEATRAPGSHPDRGSRGIDRFRTLILVAATFCVGLMAGVFVVYATTIMPGLGRTEDRVFVAAFQSLDRAIVSWIPGLILSCFASIVLAGVLHLPRDRRSALPLVVVALCLFTASIVITGTVHVPLNDEIKAAGDPSGIADLDLVRASFDESRWTAWNWVRVVLSSAAFGCLAWALALSRRGT